MFLTTVVNYFNIQEEDLETRMMKAIESQKPRLPSTTPKALQAGLVQSVGKFVLMHCTLQKNLSHVFQFHQHCPVLFGVISSGIKNSNLHIKVS